MSELEPPVIDFKNFTIFPPGRNMPIVYNFNLRVEKGSLVALMGGSGCGKTTLMLYLTRRMRNLAHWGVTAESAVFPESVSFVAQKEMFYPYDTPRNHLLFIRQRHFAETFEESKEAVSKVLELVGLVDEEKLHMQIGEGGRESVLAGGERRLLTVAAALITEPKVVILDEPTTGLDAFTALTVVRQLHAISKKSGTTFVVSIHQPSAQVIATFDSVIHMTPPAGNFEPKPAGDDASVEGEEASPLTAIADRKLNVAAPHASSVKNLSAPSKIIHLFRLSLWRAVLRTATNWRAGALRVAASLSFALMCSVAWAQLDFSKGSSVPDIIGMSLAIIGLSFAPIILNATLFSIERETLLEEYVELSDLVLSCDMFARLISDLILGLFAASAILVSAPIIGIKYTGYFFLTLWMQAWAADSFGGWISMLAPPHVSIGIIIPTVGFLSVALGTGLMQPLIQNEGYIFHVCKWGSFFKYGFQAVILQELPRASTPCTNCLIPTGTAMLDQLHLMSGGYETTMGFQYLMLFSFMLLLRVLSYFTLRVLIKSGNRRYHYDRKSAGGAAAPVHAAAHADEGGQNQEHLPEQRAKQQIEDCHLLSHRWIIAPVMTVPSFIDKITSKIRGVEAIPRRVLAVREFHTKPRQLVAIMGPTGSGKSLLLRSMCGRLGAGVQAESPTQFFSSHPTATVQFVDGNDEILPNLHAIEPVAFHLALFDSSLSHEQAYSEAAAQLVALGIAKEKHHNAAYTLSGGQLRRLSVACKSALHPAVLCMDEPTSGLDHIAAVKLGEHLRQMSHDNCMSIVCSLQQPERELLQCFDSFVFMCSGKIAIQGTEEECRAFFNIAADVRDWAEEALYVLSRSSVCLAEQQQAEEGVLQIATPQSAAVANAGPNTVVPCSLYHEPHRGTLFCTWELTKRSVLNRWIRAPIPTLIAFLIRYLLLPLALSILLVQIGKNDVYYFNRSGLIFVYCSCLTFSSMLSGAVNFPTQRKIVEEEVKANLYTTTSYLLSQWFTNNVLEDFAGCVLGSIVLKYIAHLNADLGIIIVASFVISQCCDSIGFICGLHRSLSVASGLTVLVLMPFMIGANVITTTMQVTRIPVLYVLEVLSTVRYAYLIIFYSEVKESSNAATALAVFTGYGLRVEGQEKWSEDTTLWPVFCCYMVLLRIVTLLIYRRLICPSCNQ